MAGLFLTLSKLNQLKDKNNYNMKQRAFILKILEGNEQWSCLEILASTTELQQLNALKNALDEEISETSILSFQSPYWNYQYLKNIKSVLADVQGTLNQIERIKTLSTKDSDQYTKFAKKMDTLYKETLQTYNGTIMLPVNQALEPRIGNSGGECFGYVAKWATQIIKNGRPFGLHVNQQQTLKPVLFSSSLARKNPEINHLAILTKEVSIYQELQSSVKELIKNLSSPKTNSNQGSSDGAIDFKKNSDYVFYKSVHEMARTLVDMAHKDPKKVYNLNILAYTGGHALGFCVIDKKYHFFDSNSGWYRFDKENDFINWFPYYYKQRGYKSYYFNEYAISTYSSSKSSDTVPNKNESLSWNPFTIVMLTILSPFIALYIASFLVNHFIIRGLRYLGIRISDYFDSKNDQPETKELDSIDDPTSIEIIPKSLEPLDLAVKQNSTKQKPSQTEQVLDYLDLPVRDKSKCSSTKAFFKDPQLIKPHHAIEEETPDMRAKI